MTESQTRYGHGLIVLLGLFAFTCALASHNITDGDLWGKLGIGASLWEKGHLLHHDIFAFTPTLPVYVDHEWGSGFVFYGVLKVVGPAGLMALKIALAVGALGFAFGAGRKQGCDTDTLLFLAIPCAACLMTGFIPVLRSHTFTYFFFGVTLFCLEEFRAGARWPMLALPLAVMAWTNLHGGFVVGLGAIFWYTAIAIFLRKDAARWAGTAAACAMITFVNPYSFRFWQYLIPALLHPRAKITEWRPLPLLAWDEWVWFRVLFVLTVAAVALGWKRVSQKNYCGLFLLLVTALMGWRGRRHGPFFGVAALAFAGPYYAAAIRAKFNRPLTMGILYIGIAFFAAVEYLPRASAQPLAPVGEDPVREADILSLANAQGNLATPFDWGSYLTWRLYPNVKVSMDGRYEAAYPESTFLLNAAFFDREGDWMKLCRLNKVDFVILDLRFNRLQPEDLTAQGYVLIWKQDKVSALLCLPEHAAALNDAVRQLPPFTIDPLDLKTRPATLYPAAGGPS